MPDLWLALCACLARQSSCPCAAIVFLFLLVNAVLRARNLKRKLDLPRVPGPPGLPLVGNLLDMLRPNFHKVLAHWAAKYGEVFRINILGLDGVVVASPEAVSAVLGLGGPVGSEVPKHAQSYWSLDLLWGTGDTHTVITGLSTDTWKTVHRAVAPCFNTVAVRQKFQLVRSKAEDLAMSVRSVCGQPIDVQEAGMRFTLDVIVLSGFGYDFKAVDLQRPTRVVEVLPYALQEIQTRMISPLQTLSWTRAARKANACIREYNSICGDLLDFVLAQGPPADSDNSVGAALRRARHVATGASLSPAQLKAEIGVFILGGFATTAHSLSYTLFALAAKPALQHAIEAELVAAGLLTPGLQLQRQVQHEDLRSLTYVSNVVKESLRMFPVIAGVPRLTNRPIQLGPYLVPTNTMVYVLFYRMHNNARLWHRPEEFLPERWSERKPAAEKGALPAEEAACPAAREVLTTARNEKKYLPFSEGPRGCLGQRLAIMELIVALTVLCQHFTFELCGSVDAVHAAERMALTLHVPGGIMLHCHPRAHGRTS